MKEAEVANNLAALYSEMGHFGQCGWWSRRAMIIAKTGAQRTVYDAARDNRISALLAEGRAEAASRLVEESAREAHSQNYMGGQAHAWHRASYCSLEKGLFSDVLGLSFKAHSAFLKISQPREATLSLHPAAKLLRHLGARNQARKLFLSEGISPDPVFGNQGSPTTPLLLEFFEWMRTGRVWVVSKAPSAADPSTEEQLETLTWRCEDCLAEGKQAAARALINQIFPLAKRWPHFEAKLASLLMTRLIHCQWDQSEILELQPLLKRCVGGVHGLRLLGFLLQEKSLRGRPEWERLAERRLAFVKAHSPAWAWRALMRFPEVRAMGKGRYEV